MFTLVLVVTFDALPVVLDGDIVVEVEVFGVVI